MARTFGSEQAFSDTNVTRTRVQSDWCPRATLLQVKSRVVSGFVPPPHQQAWWQTRRLESWQLHPIWCILLFFMCMSLQVLASPKHVVTRK